MSEWPEAHAQNSKTIYQWLKLKLSSTSDWNWSYLPMVEIEVICQLLRLKLSANGWNWNLPVVPRAQPFHRLTSFPAWKPSSLPNTKWLLISVTHHQQDWPLSLFHQHNLSTEFVLTPGQASNQECLCNMALSLTKLMLEKKYFHILSQFTILCLVDFIAFMGHRLLDTPATLLHTQPRSSHPKKF